MPEEEKKKKPSEIPVDIDTSGPEIDVTVEEAPTSEELQEEQEFLDEMFQTEIIQTSFEFLKSFNYVSDVEEYRNKIYKLWFELYDRDGTSKNVLGSR